MHRIRIILVVLLFIAVSIIPMHYAYPQNVVTCETGLKTKLTWYVFSGLSPIMVTWTDPGNPAGTTYLLQLITDVQSNFTRYNFTSNTTSVIVTPPKKGNYWMRIQAVLPDGSLSGWTISYMGNSFLMSGAYGPWKVSWQ